MHPTCLRFSCRNSITNDFLVPQSLPPTSREWTAASAALVHVSNKENTDFSFCWVEKSYANELLCLGISENAQVVMVCDIIMGC